MLTEIFKSVLLLSAAGSVLGVLLLCVKPVTRRVFSPKWQYYIWLTVLIVLILPVRFSLPQKTVDIPMEMQMIVTDMKMTESQTNDELSRNLFEVSPEKYKIALPQNMMWYLSVVWLLGMIAGLLIKSLKYLIFLKEIHKNSHKDNFVPYIPKKLQVRRTDMLDAPLIIGLIKPELYLPDTALSEDSLNYILMHELTHYKRRDILYKWFTMFVLSVHWFNPVIHIISKQIDLDCEVSCDFSVADRLSEQERSNYMNMILDMLINSRNNTRPLTTQMASNKKTLKRRFEMIRNKKKTSGLVSVLSVVIAVTMLGTSVLASGMLSDLRADDYTIEITNNGEKIKFDSKPFIENDEVYLPLRETLEKINAIDNQTTKIEWNNGIIDIFLQSENGLKQYSLKIGSEIMYVNLNTKQITSISNNMVNVPILRNGIAYISYDYFDYMLDQYSNENKVLNYSVYDKSGNLINTDNSNYNIGTITVDENGKAVLNRVENSEPEIFNYDSEFMKENVDYALKQIGVNVSYEYRIVSHQYISNNKAIFYVEVREENEDSLDYLTIIFLKNSEDGWVADDYYLEK